MILNENPGIAIKTIAEGNPEIMGAVAGVLYSFLKKDLKAA